MIRLCLILAVTSVFLLSSCGDGKPQDGDPVDVGNILVVGTGQAGFKDSPEPQFNKPIRLAPFGADSILVADIYNHAIRVVDVRGNVKTIVGGPDKQGHLDGLSDVAMLDSPHGVAVSDRGLIAVAEAQNHTVRVLEPVTGADGTRYQVTTRAGVPKKEGVLDGPAGQALFKSPHAIGFSSSMGMVVCDIGNARIRSIQDGVVRTISGGVAAKDQTFKYPMDLTLAADGSVYMVDAGFMCVFHQEEGKIPKIVPLDRPLKTPHGVCLTRNKELVIAELRGHQVSMVDAKGGTLKTIFGSGKAGSAANELNEPAAVLVHAGKLWIADLGNHQIKIVDMPAK